MENDLEKKRRLEDSSLDEVSGGRGFGNLLARGRAGNPSTLGSLDATGSFTTLEVRGTTGGVRFLGRNWFFPKRRKNQSTSGGKQGGGSSSENLVDL